MKAARLIVCTLIVSGIALQTQAGTTKKHSSSPASSLAQAVATYARLPLTFEPNEGQSDSQVRFLSRGQGYALFLTSNEAVLKMAPRRGTEGETKVVRMKLLGAELNSRIAGIDPRPGYSNYFTGKDPAGWRSAIRQYAKVHYANVYPGIDLLYYGNQRQLEYDFVVRPGSDPGVIRIGFEGAPPTLDNHGNLILATNQGEVRFNRPVVYQRTPKGKRPIPARYVVRGEEAGFELGEYDRSRELVIDPLLSYSSFLGGGRTDSAVATTLDSAGDQYVTGTTISADFPVSTTAFQKTCGTDGNCNLTTGTNPYDVFVSKLNPAGTQLMFSTYVGGEEDDESAGIAIDSSKNVYVSGHTTSCLFPTTAGSYKTSFPLCAGGGSIASFVFKLNSTGTALTYSTFIGVTNNNQNNAIALDSAGDAYVVGLSTDSTYPTTSGAFQVSAPNPSDNKAVFTKLNAAGTALVYSTYLAGSQTGFNTQATAVAVDSTGKAYLTGPTTAPDFPTTAGVVRPTCIDCGGFDLFVSKIDPSLSGTASLVYSTYYGGHGRDRANAIAVDSAGEAFVGGYTAAADFITTTGAFQTGCPTNCTTNLNGFVFKLNATATATPFSTYIAGANNGTDPSLEGVWAVAIDAGKNVYVTGGTASTAFPTLNPTQASNGGGTDVFVSELNSAGTKLVFSTYLGGANDDTAYGIAVGGGVIYVAGSTGSPTFPVTSKAFQKTCGTDSNCNNTTDGFVAHLAAVATDLSVTNSGTPNPVTSGSNETYTIVVKNNGPDTAAGVKITDIVPTGAVFSSVSVTQGTCSGTTTVTCTVGTLANAATATETLVLKITATSGSKVTDKATVSSTSFDSNKTNNSATVVTNVQ
jgi:uncharacterized repeat protein (TIGR01451 family)